MNLIRELEGDLATLRRMHADVREATGAVRADPGKRMNLDALAARLHRLYSCIEDAAYRVSVHINGEVPKGGGGHKALLERTSLDVPGKRRALWRRTPFGDLKEMLDFRHFFRHNYAAELDRDKLLAVADVALRAMPLVEADVESFCEDQRT